MTHEKCDITHNVNHRSAHLCVITPSTGTTKLATCLTAENPVKMIGASFANTTILPFLFNSQRMAMKELIWGYRDQMPVSAALAFTGICVLACVGQEKKNTRGGCGASDLAKIPQKFLLFVSDKGTVMRVG